MNNFALDLWPDDIAQVDTIRTPREILIEQAEAIGQKTRNVVEAEVQVRDSYAFSFHYGFYLVAPFLGEKKLLLFSIGHDFQLYPSEFQLVPNLKIAYINKNLSINKANIISVSNENIISVSNETELIEVLRAIFAADYTRKLIASIILQSRTT